MDIPMDGTIIAADGGADYLLKQHKIPDVLIGDFDSISEEGLEKLRGSAEILQFPREKDKTDSELALDYCLENDYNAVTLVNAVNGRLEHSLANIFMAEKFSRKGMSIHFYNKDNEIYVLRAPDELELASIPGDEISLIPLTDEVRVETVKGCKYPLCNEVLLREESRGISNVAESEHPTIKITQGILLIVRGR